MPVKLVARSNGRESSSQAARQQLDRILGSRTFQPVERLKRFLTFVVTETLDGRGDQLKEYVIAVQVFGKEDVVRSPDRSARARAGPTPACATRTLLPGRGGPRRDLMLELPKGGYAPTFKRPRPGPRPCRARSASPSPRRTALRCCRSADRHPRRPGSGPFCRGTRGRDHPCAFENGRRCASWPRRSRRLSTIRGTSPSASMPRPSSPAARAPRTRASVLVVTRGRRGQRPLRLVRGSGGLACRYRSRSRRPSPARSSPSLQPDEGSPTGRAGSAAPPRTSPPTTSISRAATISTSARKKGCRKRSTSSRRPCSRIPGSRRHTADWPMPTDCCAHYACQATRRRLDEGRLERRHGGDARRQLVRGAHVARARAGRRRTGTGSAPSASSCAPSRSTRSYSTAHHWYAMSCLVPMERLDEALEQMQQRAGAGPGVVDHRARPRDDAVLPPRFRRRTRPVRSHHRAQSRISRRPTGCWASSRSSAATWMSRLPRSSEPCTCHRSAPGCRAPSRARWRSRASASRP